MYDLFVHRSVAFVEEPAIHVVGLMPITSRGIRKIEIAIAEKATLLPSGPLDITSPDVPSYPRMMDKVFAHLKRDISEYRAFRFRLGYPPQSAMFSYKYEMPEKP